MSLLPHEHPHTHPAETHDLGYQIVEAQPQFIWRNTPQTLVVVEAPAGKVVVSGGVSFNVLPPGTVTQSDVVGIGTYSAKPVSPTRFEALVYNHTGLDRTVTGWAVCIDGTPGA